MGIIIALGIVVGIFLLGLLFSLKVVRPTERGLIERWGKYSRFAEPGLQFLIPIAEHMVRIDVTENMVEAGNQEIITNDNLNASVDAQVYFKVNPDEQSVKNSEYNVADYETQIVALARSTLRNIVGTMTLKSANSERNKINGALFTSLDKETKSWGISVVRTELKEINPPKDVQETMNKVVKAENEKTAAIDYATAAETKADGERRAAIKAAEGIKQAKILAAQGQAMAIQLVNKAAEKYFIGNAQTLKKLEVAQASLEKNSKIVVPSGAQLINVVGLFDKEIKE